MYTCGLPKVQVKLIHTSKNIFLKYLHNNNCTQRDAALFYSTH